MSIDVFLVLVFKVALGALAIQAPGRPLSVERATKYAYAATWHGLRAGVDPFELIAIARNESDFVETARGPDGRDCGLTQTRVTVTRYTCKQLLGSAWLAFQEAARELKEYAASCRGRPDYDRCRLNRYNSGVRYATRGVHGRYYLRVGCFAEAARQGASVGSRCRRVTAHADIARVLRRAVEAPSSVVAVAERPSL